MNDKRKLRCLLINPVNISILTAEIVFLIIFPWAKRLENIRKAGNKKTDSSG